MASDNQLHGITLARILDELVAHFGWPELGKQINIRCFQHDPSIKSSLTFLRRTPWARERVESLYLTMVREREAALAPATPPTKPAKPAKH